MQATFISHLRNYSECFVVNGDNRFIEFVEFGYPYNCCTYRTSNPEEIEALKKSSSFGKFYHLQEEIKDVAPEQEPEKTYVAVYDAPKRTQEAKKILVEEYGYDKDKLASKADVVAAAEELNIHFPNL